METNRNLTFAGRYYSSNDLDVLNADGTSTGLRRQSIEVFCFLARHSNRVVTRQELEDEVWGEIVVTDDSLTKCISEIRRVLCDDKRSVLKLSLIHI